VPIPGDRHDLRHAGLGVDTAVNDIRKNPAIALKILCIIISHRRGDKMSLHPTGRGGFSSHPKQASIDSYDVNKVKIERYGVHTTPRPADIGL
jgi:hypothetical protein